jgi:hypothetical protein
MLDLHAALAVGSSGCAGCFAPECVVVSIMPAAPSCNAFEAVFEFFAGALQGLRASRRRAASNCASVRLQQAVGQLAPRRWG